MYTDYIWESGEIYMRIINLKFDAYFMGVGNSARGMNKSRPHILHSLFSTKLNVKKFYYLMCPPLSFDHRNIEINNIDKSSLYARLFIGEQLGCRLHG